MSEKSDLEVISTKVTRKFNIVIEKFLVMDSHVTKSDLVRDAIREKIKREAPQLLEEMMKED